jgi:hypothetical protein
VREPVFQWDGRIHIPRSAIEAEATLLRGGADVPSSAVPVRRGAGGTIRREGVGQVLGLR